MPVSFGDLPQAITFQERAMMGDFMRFCSDEPLDVLVDPRRPDEQSEARATDPAGMQTLDVRPGIKSVETIGEAPSVIAGPSDARRAI